MSTVKVGIIAAIRAAFLALTDVGAVYVGPDKPGTDDARFDPATVVSGGGVALEVLVGADASDEPRMNIEAQSFTVSVIAHLPLAVTVEPAPINAQEWHEIAAVVCARLYGCYAAPDDWALQTWGGLAQKTTLEDFMGAVVIDPQYGTHTVVHEFRITYRFEFGAPGVAV